MKYNIIKANKNRDVNARGKIHSNNKDQTFSFETAVYYIAAIWSCLVICLLFHFIP
jgi:hypothetical protein